MAALLRDLVPQILQHNDEWRLTLLRHWNTIIGTLQTRVRLEKIYDDTLIIGVYESHWMHELHLFSSVLIDSINRYLGHERIAHLRFKLVEEKKQLSKFSWLVGKLLLWKWYLPPVNSVLFGQLVMKV